MKRNMKQWLSRIPNPSTRKAMPFATFSGMDLLGRPVSDLYHDGRVQYECMAALAERYPSLAAHTAMDLSAEAEAFGSRVRLSDTEAPTVIGSLVSDLEGIRALALPAVGAGRTGAYIEAAALAAADIVDRPVFGGAIGPFSLACRLMEMGKFMVMLRREPETAEALLEKATAFLIDYVSAYKEAGANGVILAEPAAGLISPTFCLRFSSEYVRRILNAVQDDDFIVILHNCGNTEILIAAMLYTGADALHFGNVVDMRNILAQIPRDVLAFGNIDPVKVMRLGSVRDVKWKTLELLEQMSKHANFVLSTGCETPPGVPVANLDAFYKTLDIFNATQDIRHKWLFDN